MPMTSEAVRGAARPSGRRPSAALAVLGVAAAVVVLWYLGALASNWAGAVDAFGRAGQTPSAVEVVEAAMSQERPVTPAPHQVLAELQRSVLGMPVTSKRSLVYHAAVTLSATLVGFAIGSCLGMLLAVAIVRLRSVERSLMPWLVASQTVPILAVAPLVIVALGSIGLTGLLPKAIIAAYLCFFPVTVGMVKGLEAPDRLQHDLMRTYSATPSQVLWRLRLPSALPYLFASLKVAIAASLVGTIVAELPTGAQAGLGSRLLAGSYYGQTVQIWGALVAAAALASVLVFAVALVERALGRVQGARVTAGGRTKGGVR